VIGAIRADCNAGCVCVCRCGTVWGSLSLQLVAAPSWCRGLFSGSNILVCLAISAGERQEICQEISGCVACYLYLG
jgi:hypothetical protein